MEQIWDILQIDAGADVREIKRAYARLSKEIHPEEGQEEFQRLYEAYRKALRYASHMEKKKTGETEIPLDSAQEEESGPGAEKWDRYERFGFHAGDAQKEQLRLERIEYFLYHWDRRVFAGVKTGTFLTEEWITYLESTEFQEIMWYPIVLRTIAEGVEKYFLRKEEILLFFWNLYGFEELKGKPCQDEELLLYETLYRVYKNRIIRQKYAENMAVILKERQKYRRKIVISNICALIGIIPVSLCAAFLGIPVEISTGIFGAFVLFIVVRLVTGYIKGE